MNARHPLLRRAAALAFLCAGFAIVAPTAIAAQAVLKGTVVARGDKVTLGDLFDESAFATTPEAAQVPVLAAPRPGESIALDAVALQRFAAAHQIEWPNTQGLTAIKIERASKSIGADMVAQALLDALQARGLTGNLKIRYAGTMPELRIAADANPSVAVQSLNVEPTTGQFAAALRAPLDDPMAPTITVQGRAYRVAEVPVLARDMKPGETIAERDIQITEMPVEKLGQNVITAATDLVGTAARRMLRAGEPLRLGDIEAPVLVKKGALVTMTVRGPGLSLTAEGRALEDGAHGDAIRVMNTNSKRTIAATVEAEGIVSVGTAAPVAPALAANDAASIN
jgi:flagellar basal body P-ring formation protein FlgA